MQQPDYTVNALCALMCISRGSVYTLIGNGAFPNAYSIGGRWRIPHTDVEAYREANRVDTTPIAVPKYSPKVGSNHGYIYKPGDRVV